MMLKQFQVKKNSWYFILLAICFMACDEPFLKPKGYPQIDFPESTYKPFESCFFITEIPSISVVDTKIPNATNPCWFNLIYPEFNATFHCTYHKVNENLNELIDHSYKIKNNHIQVASNIPETVIRFPENNVGGILFEIQGISTASPLNFFVTDSTNHFLSGSLYFNHSPNNDSVGPVINYLMKDLKHFVSQINWKE